MLFQFQSKDIAKLSASYRLSSKSASDHWLRGNSGELLFNHPSMYVHSSICPHCSCAYLYCDFCTIYNVHVRNIGVRRSSKETLNGMRTRTRRTSASMGFPSRRFFRCSMIPYFGSNTMKAIQMKMKPDIEDSQITPMLA